MRWVRTGAVAMGALALAAGSTTAASADTKLSADDLARAVGTKSDVKAYYKKTKTVMGPTPGTGADKIPSQGLCYGADGEIDGLNSLPKRQAWSDYRMGQNKGVLTLLLQYKSVGKAETKYAKIADILDGCPEDVVAGDLEVEQQSFATTPMYQGDSLLSQASVDDNGEKFVQLVQIKRVGASISFTRYTQQGIPGLAHVQKAVEMTQTVSALMAYRYHGLAG